MLTDRVIIICLGLNIWRQAHRSIETKGLNLKFISSFKVVNRRVDVRQANVVSKVINVFLNCATFLS